MHVMTEQDSIDLRAGDTTRATERTARKNARRFEHYRAALDDPKRTRAVYSEIIDRSTARTLTMSERAVLHCLLQYADVDLSNCFPRQSTLAEELGVTRWCINRLMASLREKEFIVIHIQRYSNGARAASGVEFCIPRGIVSSMQWRSGTRFSRFDSERC